jgi:hypothetical protein
MNWAIAARRAATKQKAIHFQRSRIMKTIWTILASAFVLAGLFAPMEASEKGCGVYRNAASDPSDPRSKPRDPVKHDPGAGPAKATPSSIADRPAKAGKVSAAGEKSVACKPAPEKCPPSNVDKHCGDVKCGQGLKTDCDHDKVWCWNNGCWGCWPPDGNCSWYYSSCYDSCSEFNIDDTSSWFAMPDVDRVPAPAAKIVRIVNALGTQATLSFKVNGRAYSLEAGKTQELELSGDAVIEFDRAPGGSKAIR